MTKIVGIGGRLASGKDCIADYLVEEHGWVKLGMSDALAGALYTLNPLVSTRVRFLGIPLWVKHVRYQEVADRVGYVEAKTLPEVRRLLQVLGTEVGRNMIDEDVWTDMMVKKVRSLISSEVPGIIVTGVRFENEIEAISDELSGALWWVVRPSLEDGVNASHPSENSVSASDFDVEIWNTGTLEDLYEKVRGLVILQGINN